MVALVTPKSTTGCHVEHLSPLEGVMNIALAMDVLHWHQKTPMQHALSVMSLWMSQLCRYCHLTTTEYSQQISEPSMEDLSHATSPEQRESSWTTTHFIHSLSLHLLISLWLSKAPSLITTERQADKIKERRRGLTARRGRRAGEKASVANEKIGE